MIIGKRLLLAVTATTTACLAPPPTEPPELPEPELAVSEHRTTQTQSSSKELDERRALAASGRQLVASGGISIAATDADMLIPLDLAPTLNAQPVTYTGSRNAASPQNNFGTVLPTKGNSFLMMSTGLINGLYAEPGSDHSPAGVDGDTATYTFRVTVPPGVNRMSFDYNFLSAESPEFIGQTYNDTFEVFVTDAQGRRSAFSASVDSANFHPVTETNIGASPYLLYTDNPAGVDSFLSGVPGNFVDTGVTDFQRADVAISSGPVTIELQIRDVGDGILDSAVLVDNFSFSAVEVVDPRVGLIDENTGRVLLPGGNNGLEMITFGEPVHSVVADGVTQVLLRAKVSVAGTASFTIQSGDIADGELSANTNVLNWGLSATSIPTISVAGQPYIFALYRSPAIFSRGDGDLNAKTRTATILMTFNPNAGNPVTQEIAMGIVRPPVVVVHDLWSGCISWLNPEALMDNRLTIQEQPFTISCASYDQTSAKGLEANNSVVPESINQSLEKLRGTGVAGTQADIIGHGVGGLLARRYIDHFSFARPSNFYQGSVNRLIMVDTPNLGLRFADELVRMREFAKNRLTSNGQPAWTPVNALLKGTGSNIFIDNADCDNSVPALCNTIIDELTSESEIINQIGLNQFPPRNISYHAIAGLNGRTLARSAMLSWIQRALYIQLENQHPLTWNGSTARKQSLILGNQSDIFCTDPVANEADQHDLFATLHEQLGGLILSDGSPLPGVTSLFPATSGVSSHFHVHNNPLHTTRLRALLNAPASSFTAQMPPPSTILRKNSCPIVITPPPAPPLGAMPFHALAMRNLAITAPADGSTVTPGSTLTVSVTAGGDDVPESILLVSPEGVIEIEGPPPFTASFPVPASALGSMTLKAYGFYPMGEMASSPSITLNVASTATLDSLFVLNGNAVLGRPGVTRQLTVLGRYSDGILRDVTEAAKGTRYTVSSLSLVANVSPGGLVTGLDGGDATIVIRNGTKITSINVHVDQPCGNEVADPGEECDDGNRDDGDGCSSTCQRENHAPEAVCASPTVCNDAGLCSASVTTLGAGSTDPDGDALAVTQTPAGPYGVGQHAVLVSVSDGELEASCDSQLAVNDCEQPALACPASFAVECSGAGGAEVTPPGAQASDNCSATLTAPSAGRRSLGAHQLAYAAADPSGNQASCATTVTVQDTTSPTLSCPAPTVAECTGGGQATVSPGAGQATDSCTTAAVSGPGSGSYPVGTTPISYSAIDLSGNQASCSTTVTVRDTLAPTISCPAPKVAECTGSGHATVDPGDATVSDVCTAATVNDPGASSYPLGTTTVGYTATDPSGNQASCATTVTVRDTRAPVATSTGAPPLWPPAHGYHIVSLADCGIQVVDRCAGPLPPSVHQAQVNCVTSDEPDDAPGDRDGDTTDDIVVIDAQTVKLRAEHDLDGDGRLYNIYFKIVDAAGNARNGVCPVEVRSATCQPGNESDPSCPPDDSGGKHSVCL